MNNYNNNIKNLSETLRYKLNKMYDNGGTVDDERYNNFVSTLPNNQKPTSDFDVRRYWELNGRPKTFDEAIKLGMYTMNDDGYYHANSVAYNNNTDNYEILKSVAHPSRMWEQVAYFSNPEFNKQYYQDGNVYKRYLRAGEGPYLNTNLYAGGGGLFGWLSNIISRNKDNTPSQQESETDKFAGYWNATDEEKSKLSKTIGPFSKNYNTWSVGDYGDSRYDVIESRYRGIHNALKNRNFSDEDIDRLMPMLLTQNILEGGWQLNRKDNNFGGMMITHSDSSQERMKFNTPEEFYSAYIDNLDDKWGDKTLGDGKGWRNAKDIYDYAKIINHEDLGLHTEKQYNDYIAQHPNTPIYLYTPEWKNGNTGLMSENKFGGIHTRVEQLYALMKQRMQEWYDLQQQIKQNQ